MDDRTGPEVPGDALESERFAADPGPESEEDAPDASAADEDMEAWPADASAAHEDIGAWPAPAVRPASAPSAEPSPSRALPSAREVVTRGLLLASAGSGELRRASLYFGLIVLATCGPFVAYTLASIVRLDELPSPEDGAAVILVWVAILGAVAIGIETAAVAIAVLGGRAAGTPMSLRAAVARSRVVFWRLAGAWLITTLASVFVRWVVGSVLPALTSPEGLVAGLVATVATAPLTYAQTGIVIGDVGVMIAIRRSIVLTRARPAYAAAIVAFALAATIVQIFAISGGLEIVVRIEELLAIDVATSGGFAILLLVALGLLVAFGSLVFTIVAIQAAPQVVAFLALTGYSAGLRPDEGAASRIDATPSIPAAAWAAPAGAARPFRWVTLPMTGGIVLAVVVLLASASRFA